MSGDVQPRKRKDKKKRKDEQIEETVAQPQPPSTPILPNDDTNIHVHKERSLGGGVCAKCVFFLLMIVISVVIGFTITDYRGQTDVEIPEAESRFASIFEGWTETATDDDHDALHSGEVSHEEESDESHHDDDDDHDDSDDREEEEEEVEETEEEEEEPSDEDRPSDEVEDDEEEETEEISESQQEEEDEEVEEDDESREVTDEDEDNQIESEGEEEDIPAEEESEDEAVASEGESEEVKQPEKDVSEEKDAQDQEKVEEEIEEGNVETTTANMAAKVGVGLSLFIVAYVVLIKKWRTDKPVEEDTIKEEQATADLTRRNTFVPPPTLEEVEQDIENVEEEYSDEDEEIEESDDERRTMPAGKRQYEELRSTYRRTLPLESDNKKYGDSEEEEEGEIEDEQYEEEIEEEEEEEIDEEYEDDDDEDEKLMKKLEARYGRLGAKSSSKYADEENDDEDDDDKNFKSWKRIKKTGSEAESESENERSGAQNVYEFQNVTNAEDYVYKEDLDEAQRYLSNNIQVGLSIFIKFLENHPNSPRALYGKAEALDLLADKKRSNEILQESIQSYLNVINAENVPPVLFLKAAERCINRMRFIGNYGRAISVHKKLIQRFQGESKYKNDLAVTYLTINRISEARSLLIDILEEFPNDGFALVHYGFILKTVDNDLNKAIDYLNRGIRTREDGVIDGRFYFHLGDALARLGKNNEAMQVYEDGVLNKVFLSKYQRSLYNVDRLTGRPWWAKEETPYSRLYEQLERNYHRIKEEGLAVLNQKGYFKDESENLRDVGDWKQFELYARGVKHAENCKKCPLTCKIVDSEPDVKGCRRGQVKFSVMHPGTHVWPHCGPTNCRLRIHLGLKVPEKTYIRVGEETRSWEEGKIFIFDDSFEHEVWHNGTEFRLVLIVDVWHPELTKNEKYNLSAI